MVIIGVNYVWEYIKLILRLRLNFIFVRQQIKIGTNAVPTVALYQITKATF